MKIAVSGKGGAGKTTVASLLALGLAERGEQVLAIDADPDPNLGGALGVEDAHTIVPVSHMTEMMNERLGTTPSAPGYFRLNPQVDDIPERFSAQKNGIKLLVMGTVKKGGSGCVCPESTLLKSLLTHLLLRRDEKVILDMEAGIEHLGRGTASAVDAFISVAPLSLIFMPRPVRSRSRPEPSALELFISRCSSDGFDGDNASV